MTRAIHCHDGRLPTPWDADMIARWPDDCEYEREVAMSQAAAVLELVGPRKLEWTKHPNARIWRCTTTNQYRIALDDIANEYSALIDGCLNWHNTLEAAQAAAQAHADAAHWANTKIGGSDA